MRILTAVCLCLLASIPGVPVAAESSAPARGHYVQREVRVAGVSHRYSVWLPPGFKAGAQWPAILFLHGAGECGTDAVKPTRVGLGPVLDAQPEAWPVVVVFAQKPLEEEEWWEREALALATLDAAQREFALDPQRIALMGMSQGGHGAWLLAARHPTRWSALVPICGYGRARTIGRRVARIPVWTFHGMRDDIVDPADTQRIAEEIRAERARLGLPADGLRVTLYPEANHGSWEPALREPELPGWILAQRRGATSTRR